MRAGRLWGLALAALVGLAWTVPVPAQGSRSSLTDRIGEMIQAAAAIGAMREDIIDQALAEARGEPVRSPAQEAADDLAEERRLARAEERYEYRSLVDHYNRVRTLHGLPPTVTPGSGYYVIHGQSQDRFSGISSFTQ